MATPISQLKATAAELAARTPASGLLVWDETNGRWVGGDGSTAGGIPMAREDKKNDGALGYQQDVKTNDYAVVVGDIGKMIVANKATAINFSLGTAAALTSKFVAAFKNIGAGTLTITPNGSDLIEGVNAAISIPAGASLILKGDGASFRTYASTVDLTQASIHNATAKTALADADEFGVIDTAASNVLKKVTLANMVSSIFKASRKIANAYFDSSFRLWDATDNTKGLAFDISVVPTGTTKTFKPLNGAMFAILQDQKASGTTGGSSVASAWTTRTLNTKVMDVDSIVTLASNQFTPAIDCLCFASAPFFQASNVRVRIYNVTDGVEIARGPSMALTPSSGVGAIASVNGRLTAGKAYRLEYYCNNAVASTGLGTVVGDGGVEVYASVLLQGIAA